MEFKDVYNVYTILLQKIWRVHQRTMVNSTSLDWETLFVAPWLPICS